MNAAAIPVNVSYRREWQDGFGARGWKLDVSMDEPSVIAATAEHGVRIPTSVLVHDILDHHLCGFGIGGHRNEAMALIQLASRTGADPRPDFSQIVEEDIMHGHCNGESLRSFLPKELVAGIPDNLHDGRDIIECLLSTMDSRVLRAQLVERFITIGESVQKKVEARWRRLGLSYQRRGAIGLALQRILARVDTQAREALWERAHGQFIVGDRECAMILRVPVKHHITAEVLPSVS